MSILLIDDIRSFRDEVVAALDGSEEVFTVRTDTEAIDFLNQFTGVLSQVFFDFDLGTVHGKTITTLPVARHLASMARQGLAAQACLSEGAEDFMWRRVPHRPRFRVGLVVLHSSNPVGRGQLKAELAPCFRVAETQPEPLMVQIPLHEQEQLQNARDA